MLPPAVLQEDAWTMKTRGLFLDPTLWRGQAQMPRFLEEHLFRNGNLNQISNCRRWMTIEEPRVVPMTSQWSNDFLQISGLGLFVRTFTRTSPAECSRGAAYMFFEYSA